MQIEYGTEAGISKFLAGNPVRNHREGRNSFKGEVGGRSKKNYDDIDSDIDIGGFRWMPLETVRTASSTES